MLDANISVENPFFIFFPERSGSTFLVHLLNQHPDIYCDHEVFATRKIPGEDRRFEPLVKSDSEKIQILEKVYSYQEAKASGFKFKFGIQYHQYPDVYRFFLQNVCSMKLIFLYRKNLLKMAISRQNLSKLLESGQPHFLDNQSQQGVGKLRLNLPYARSYIKRQQGEIEFYKRATEVFANRMVVAYEDLCDKTDETLGQIFEFLNVGPTSSASAPPIKKITDNSLENAIENYSEMVEFFSKTPYAEFLDY